MTAKNRGIGAARGKIMRELPNQPPDYWASMSDAEKWRVLQDAHKVARAELARVEHERDLETCAVTRWRLMSQDWERQARGLQARILEAKAEG